MKVSKTPLITLREFERISQIILAIINAENGDKARSCVVFSGIGAHMLKSIFKLDAKIVLGQAIYALPNTGIFSYSDSSTASNFHCWVEAQGWFFDFSSIIFPEITNLAGLPQCQSLMLQKPVSYASVTIPETYIKFAFHIIPDDSNTIQVADFITRRAFIDLCDIAVEWYKRPPKSIPSQVGISDGYGNQKSAIITGKMKGAW